MNAQVSIDRSEPQVFTGRILSETDTHVKVQHGPNPEIGEWFARQSNVVHVKVLGKVK